MGVELIVMCCGVVVSFDKAVFLSNNRKLTKTFAGLASNYEPLVERCGKLRSEVTQAGRQ